MSTEEEFQAYKKQAENKLLKRSRITFFWLGASALFCFLFLIYGFTQSIEAMKESDLSKQQEERALKAEILLQVREKEMVAAKLACDNLAEQLTKCQSGKK